MNAILSAMNPQFPAYATLADKLGWWLMRLFCIGMLVFVAVALSIAGFYLLCITDGFGSIGLADILLVFTAVLFAVQAYLAKRRHAVRGT